MSSYTLETLEQRLKQLSHEERFAEAVALIDEEMQQFPAVRQQILFARAAFLARLQEYAQVIATFKQALASGYWYTPDWLLYDQEFQALSDNPEFLAIIQACRERRDTAFAGRKLQQVVYGPEPGNGPVPLLIALHGNDGNAPDFARYWQSLAAQNWLVVVPQSVEAINAHAYNWDDWELAVRHVQQQIQDVSEKYAINPDRIYLTGSSRGAGLAIWIAITKALHVQGFIVFAPYVLYLDHARRFLAESVTSGLRGYIFVGADDELCLDMCLKLAASNNACKLEIRPRLGHAMPEDALAVLERGLRFIDETEGY